MRRFGLMVERIRGSRRQDYFGSSYRSVLGFVSIPALLLILMVFVGSAGAAVVAGFGEEGNKAGQFSFARGIAADPSTGDVFLVDSGNARVERWASLGGFELAWGAGVADGVSSSAQTCEAVCFPGVVGVGGGQFGQSAQGVAVDASAGLSQGDVYVVDRSNLRVQKFSPNGEFLLAFGHGVNATTNGDVCVAGEACTEGAPFAGPGGFESLGRHAVAVGSLGTVYVADGHRVEEFSPSGVFEKEVELAGVENSVESLAVDSTGEFYLTAEGPEGGVLKYSATGVREGEPRDPGPAAANTEIAIGPGDELIVYASEQHHVLIYDPAGQQRASIAQSESSRGIAYNASNNSLYVLGEGEVVVVALSGSGPVVVGQSADGLSPTGARLNATVNPEGGEATKVSFEYGTSVSYGASTEPVELTGAPFEDQMAAEALTKLVPSTMYHFRAVVTNKAGQVVDGPDATFHTLPAASIENEGVIDLTSSSARLVAQINPHGVATTFVFEYGQTTAYEHSAPEEPGELGAGEVPVSRGVVVEQGVLPEHVYHYRVSTESSLGTVHGPDRTFTTPAARPNTALVDGRAWEQVSPAVKGATTLEPLAEEGGLIQSSLDGSRLTYIALAPVTGEAGGSRSIAYSQQLAQRTSHGWSSLDIATPHEEVSGLNAGKRSEYKWFSPDLSTGLVEPEGATPLEPVLMGEHGERTPYLRTGPEAYLPLVTTHDVPNEVRFGGEEHKPGQFVNGVEFITATPDAQHVFLSSTAGLTEELEPSGQTSVFEWFNGELQLVSILPNGRPASLEGGRSFLGLSNLQVRNAVSEDGARAVFEVSGGEKPGLYLRDSNARGDLAHAETVQLDVIAPGVAGTRRTPVFQDATPSGDEVLFTDTGRLTSDATANPTEGLPDLYLCRIVVAEGKLHCYLTDLTVDAHRNQPADVLGDVLGFDSTGRFVYFVANGELAPGAARGDCRGGNPWQTSGSVSCNLYVRDLRSEETRLVAVVSNRDAPNWKAKEGEDLGEVTSRVSPHGRFLAFMSTRPLTGFDNRDAVSGEPDAEVYEYDASAPGQLRCVSCSPTGARPEGVFDTTEAPGLLVDRPRVWGGQWLAGSVPGWTKTRFFGALNQSRYLNDSGRLLFNSATSLVSSDQNRREDVYEFEPVGFGSCADPSGCVALMSSGTSSEESVFLDGSESGDDVFFLTGSRLVPGDKDSVTDVYDAHVCSVGAPCASGGAGVPPACTTTDSCRAAPAPEPLVFGAPSSATFTGAGNIHAAPAPPTGRVLTRAQKLARALKACHKHKKKHPRVVCKRRARRQFGRVSRVRVSERVVG